MINVMFWNINKKNGFEQVICDVIQNESVDLLLLAEAENVNDTLILNGSGLQRKKSPNTGDQIKLTPRFYANNRGFSLDHYSTASATKRLVFTILEIPNKPWILLCGIHFPSKIHYKGETQKDIASSYVNWIKEIEDQDRRTIVFGDFNMNPFEPGMISPKTFNATLSRIVALNGYRTFQNEGHDYFYNPMWSFMGDQNFESGLDKLPGSKYFETTTDSEIVYWNVFDKVIIRPQLINELDLPSITLLEKSGNHQFITNNNGEYTFDTNNYSDHLPLTFKIII